MSTTPVRIDPRIRKRRIEVRREAGRRRLRVLLVSMSSLCVAGLAYLVVTSPLLDVDRVRVVGTEHVTAAEVQAAANVHRHAALLFLDTGAIARNVETLPWVEHASVQRVYPGTVKIVITEYTPSAYVRVANGALLVAPTGRVVARVASPPAGVVEVRGVRRPPAVGELLAPIDAAPIADGLAPALRSQVVAIDVSGGGLALDLARGGEVRLGNGRDLDAKSAAALAVLAHLGAKPFTYIDVSTPERPVSRD